MMSVIWVVAFFVLLVLETQTLEFTLLSIALGCLAAAGGSAMGLPILAQVVIAIVGTVMSLFLLAPLLRRRFTVKDTPSLVDSMIGTEVEVVEAIEPPAQGKVKLNGVVWQASSNHAIPAGATCIVSEVSGARLTVVSREQIVNFRTQSATSPLPEAAPRPEPQQDLSH